MVIFLVVGQGMMVILVSFKVAVKGYFPFVAIALNEVSDPCLLLWREWAFTTHILVIELGTVQVSCDGFAHRGIVFFHHTIVEVTKPCSPHHDFPFVVEAALAVFKSLGHYTHSHLLGFRNP